MSDEVVVVPPTSRFNRFRDLYSSFRSSKNFKLIATTILVLAVPLTVVLSMQISDFRQRASGPAIPATPPGPIISEHPISFITPQVSLKADDFYIMADGKRYNAQVAGVQVHSDPGNSTYTTLELIWTENGIEMRMFMYFSHQPNDFWRVSEIRTYNGQAAGDWIYYKGFIGNSIGSYLILPTLDLLSDSTNPSNNYTGSIHFKNLQLQAFLTQVTPVDSPMPTPTPTRTPTPAPTLTPTPTRKPTAMPTPAVTVLVPTNNSKVMAGRTIQVAASVPSTSTANKAEFYVGSTRICSSFHLPLRCTWNVPAQKGVIYSLTAKAFYKDGTSKTSPVSKVTSY